MLPTLNQIRQKLRDKHPDETISIKYEQFDFPADSMGPRDVKIGFSVFVGDDLHRFGSLHDLIQWAQEHTENAEERRRRALRNRDWDTYYSKK